MKKFELGNIYSIQTNKGLGLFQLVNIPEDKRNEVEMIRVSYNLYSKIPQDLENIFVSDFFYICFPVNAALKKNLIDLVGHIDLGENYKIPRYYRTVHYLKRDEWIIIDKENDTITPVKTLTDEQLKLSGNSVWNDTYLKERLEEGWRLENWK